MFEVGRLIARLALEGADTVARQIRAVGDEWKKLSATGQEAARTVGGPMVAAGASLVAMTGLMIREAIRWESAWAGVTKTVEGTPKQMAAIEDGLRGLAKVLPASHEEIAAVAEAAGALGVQTPNVVAFTKTMVDLGETTNLSSDQAATALARFMNVMGTAQDETSNLGSAVVDLGNKYASTEAEIVEMAQRLAGAGRQVNLTEGEVLGLATALSSVGIEAEAGGSAMSKVMIDIAASVDKGGDRVALFAKTAGMSADEFSAKWRSKPGEALAAFVTGLANAEQQGGSTLGVLEELGITEVRMRDALLRSAAASDMFTEAMDQGNASFEENTALADEAAKRYATLEAQLQITQNAINDAAIDFGQVFMPAIAAVASGVRDVAGFLGDLPPEIQGAVGVIGLLTGAVLLLGGTMLLTIPKMVEFRLAVQVLATELPRTTAAFRGFASFLTGPWGIALAAAAVGAAILQHQIDEMKASTEEWQNVIKTAESAQELFDVADTGSLLGALDDATRSAEGFQQKLDLIAHNDFARGLDGQASALKARLGELGTELATMAEADLPSAQAAFRLLAEEMELSKDQQLDLLNAMPDYRDKLVEVATANGEAADNATLLEGAMGDSAEASQTAGEAYAATADEVTTLRDELSGLVDKMLEMNGIGADSVTAQIDYQAALAESQARVEAITAGTEGYSAGLDINTQAGRDNMQALIDQAAASQEAATKTYELDGDTAALSQRLAEGRQKLIDTAIAMGASSDEAVTLANKIYGIPTAHETDILADTSEAIWSVDNFIAATNARYAYVRVVPTYPEGGPSSWTGGMTQADGGIVEFYANGGMRPAENHIAQIAKAGTTRVWNEPETGGEVYLPLAASKRPRTEQVFEEAADMLGYDVQKRGGAGRPAAQHAAVGGSGNGMVQTIILQVDGRELARVTRDYERSLK